MSEIRILHYRDHHNGGKFNGNCYIDAGEPITDIAYPIRARFKYSKFDSGFQYVWGVGTGNNQYSLKIVRDTDDYYLRVTYLNIDYNFTDYRIGIIEDISLVIVWIDDGLINIKVGSNRYANLMLLGTKTNISNEVSYSVPAVDITLGGSRYMDGAVLTLDPAGHFTGTYYDFETHYSAAGEDRQRLVFYENYLENDSDTVSDFYETYDAIIEDRPTDFWSEVTDISTYIRMNTDLSIKYRRDGYFVQEYSSTQITLFNYFTVKIGDTIAIEIDGEITWLFNISKIKLTENGHSVELKCDDIFLGLKDINPLVYIWPNYEEFNLLDKIWWSNYVQDGIECDITTSGSISLFYLLKIGVYILQYDNIISIDLSNIEGLVDSKYYDYLGSCAVTFSKLGYSWGMFKNINRSDSSVHDDAIYMEKVFREVLLQARIMYYYSDGVLTYDQISSGNVDHDLPIWNTEPETIDKDIRYNLLRCSVATSWAATYNASQDSADWGDEYPDFSSYTAFDSDDIVEISANQLSNSISKYKNKDTYHEKIFTAHLWMVIRNATTGEKRTMWNSTDSENFLHQLAGILDQELRRDYTMERITIPLISEFSPKYQEKTDDLIKRSSEIYQETEVT